MMTFTEIKEKLKEYPEDMLLEMLDIASEDILDRFEDHIEERMDFFQEELADDNSDNDQY